MNYKKLSKAHSALSTLDNSVSREILDYLHTSGPMDVTSIWIDLRIPQAQVSQKLRVLKCTGIIGCAKFGKSVAYYIDYDRARQINSVTYKLAAL